MKKVTVERQASTRPPIVVTLEGDFAKKLSNQLSMLEDKDTDPSREFYLRLSDVVDSASVSYAVSKD